MQKIEIKDQLTAKHREFIAYLQSLTPTQQLYAANDKWSAAQQAAHIYQSVRPLAIGLRLPKFVVKLIWGKANRPSKTYTELVDKYTSKLQMGGRATAPFVPKAISTEQLPILYKKINKSVERFVKNITNYTETDLDNYILPHPLLGKVTLREMLYFTIYHVQHHQKLIGKNAWINYKKYSAVAFLSNVNCCFRASNPSNFCSLRNLFKIVMVSSSP
jgi:DinB superfamily